MKTVNLIVLIAFVFFISCKTPKEQVIAKTATKAPAPPVMKPAIAVSSKDTTAKKPMAHALHRDEPVHIDNGGGQPAKSHRTEPAVSPPDKRTEASAVKPSPKQNGTYTPATLKNAPKPGGN